MTIHFLPYSDFIDFTFIFQVVLSLFAILFTYDAINGERESGTLRLTYSCPVPRATYLLAKLAGAWTGLVVPLLIPVALAILLVLVMNVPVDSTHWYRILALLGAAVLLFHGLYYARAFCFRHDAVVSCVVSSTVGVLGYGVF